MSKFKVGDLVRVVHGFYIGYPEASPYNLPRGNGVAVEVGDDDGYIKVKYGDVTSPPLNPECFDLAAGRAVRTVREIVPGRYGCVEVTEAGKTYVSIDATSIYYARDLRAAANLFNELADVLEENAEAA